MAEVRTIADGYMGNIRLKRVGVELNYTEEQVAELVKCSKDPVYFIKTYVQIVNVDKGLVPFDMWPFQEDMVRSFHANRFNIAKMPRQCGKTTTSVGYMLWCVLFQEEYTVGILANKGSLAREILGRLQKAYEYLPLWLQQGIVVWNKGNLELETCIESDSTFIFSKSIERLSLSGTVKPFTTIPTAKNLFSSTITPIKISLSKEKSFAWPLT